MNDGNRPRTHGMTRPWFLPVLVIAMALVVLGVVLGGTASLLASSLGGILVGAAFLTFDAVRH